MSEPKKMPTWTSKKIDIAKIEIPKHFYFLMKSTVTSVTVVYFLI